jgi:hypothetical protein
MTYDVFISDLILITYHIKKTKIEKFCMLIFVRFYLWTFE